MIRVPHAHGQEFILLVAYRSQDSVLDDRNGFADGGQGSAQFMRHVSDEVVLQTIEQDSLGDVADRDEKRFLAFPLDVHGPDFPVPAFPSFRAISISVE